MPMDLLNVTADHYRKGQAAFRWYRQITQYLGSLQVRAMQNDTHKCHADINSAYDFIVKYSPSVCTAIVASLTGEMVAQSFAYNAHGTAVKNPAVIYGL